MQRVHTMLPVLHKYDMRGPLGECMAYLTDQLPAGLTADPRHPGYLLLWMQLADDLQLAEIHSMCMCKLRSLAYSRRLGRAFLACGSLQTSPSPSSACGTGAEKPSSTCPHHPASVPSLAIYREDELQAAPAVRALSRDSLEAMVVSLVAAASGFYRDRQRTRRGPNPSGVVGGAPRGEATDEVDDDSYDDDSDDSDDDDDDEDDSDGD